MKENMTTVAPYHKPYDATLPVMHPRAGGFGYSNQLSRATHGGYIQTAKIKHQVKNHKSSDTEFY